MRLYLDSAPVIYLVERIQPYLVIIQTHLAQPGLALVASDLTRLECRVGPIRRGDPSLLKDFDEFFLATVDEVLSLSRDVMDRATEVRAQYGFATPDSIHIAAALLAGCGVFLTNDHRLQRVTGIQVEVI